MSITTAGQVPEMPDLACIGYVKKVGEVKLSEKGVFHVLSLEIEGRYSGKDGTFFFIFEPRWFEKSFDPKTLIEEDEAFNEAHAAEIKAGVVKRSGKNGIYRRYINDKTRPSVLQAICDGEDGSIFAEVAARFDALPAVTPKDVENILREYLTGREVGYVMTQRTDDDGSLMDLYNIARFFPLTQSGLKAITEEANNPRRRKPLVVTWDE